MARDSAIQNGLQDKFEVICADVKDIRSILKAESFDKVLCNPPYFTNSGNSCQKSVPDEENDALNINARTGKSVSRTESTATLDDFVKGASYALRFGGDVWFVIKADRMASLIYSLKSYNLEPKEATLIYPKPTSDVDVVIIKARKGAKEGLKISPFFVTDDNGEYTDKYKETYA